MTMSQTTHLIANNVSAHGFGPADSRSLPCLGVSRRVIAFSAGSSLGEHSLVTRVKFIAHKRVSKAASVLCGARPGNNRRNPDFSNPNSQGFSSNRNWPNGDGDNNNGMPDEFDILPSKNGALFSSASSLKSLPNAEPGQKDRDVIELFRRVREKLLEKEKEKEKQLCERAATEEVKTAETVKGNDDDDESWKSFFDVLRHHPTGGGSEKVSASNNGSAAFRKKVTSGSQSVGKNRNSSISNVKERNITPEPKVSPVTRPASSFRRRSPVPSLKYEPIYNSEDDDSDLEELKSEQDLEPEPEPISSLDDEYAFADMAEDKPSEEENSLDGVDQQPTEHIDLSSLKLAELRALAKSRSVKGFSKLKKSELVELLSGS